jgi:hypothetical protein
MGVNQVFIHCRTLPIGITREALFIELAANNKAVKLSGDDCIACPSSWLNDIINLHYGKELRLYHPRAKTAKPGAKAKTPRDELLPSA